MNIIYMKENYSYTLNAALQQCHGSVSGGGFQSNTAHVKPSPYTGSYYQSPRISQLQNTSCLRRETINIGFWHDSVNAVERELVSTF